MALTVHGFPVQLFVEMRDEGDVYKLVDVKIKRITHGFEPDRRGSK